MLVHAPAPEFDVSEWIGGARSLADLRGQVVLVEAFQMLCPSCVSHALPQMKSAQAAFPDLVVLGLHTVFEHHEAMTPLALRAFLSEYRIDFPVAVDRHDGDPVPVTMRRYELRGTPSTLIIDKNGVLRLSAFGAVNDLVLGGYLGRLLAEPHVPAESSQQAGPVDHAQASTTPPHLGPTATQTCEPAIGCS